MACYIYAMQMNPQFSTEAENALRLAKSTIAHLEKSDIFRDYRQAFESLTGLGLEIRPVGSFQAPLQGTKQKNAFCALMAATNKTCAACLQVQQQLETSAQTCANTVECFMGLNESAVPIRAGKKVIGYLQTGQVFLRRPTKARFQRAAKQLDEMKEHLDFEKLEAAYLESRVMTPTQYQSILRLLTIFAEHLSTTSNQLVLIENNQESPTIAKARAYIEEHKGEELSLAEVAKAVNMSAFYFCKLFKKSAGVTFTEYLSRVRVEAVKTLLLNPHKRVSEAAFEGGFQSLSQFNRIFRRTTGESPSDFRHRIHSPSHVAASGRQTIAA